MAVISDIRSELDVNNYGGLKRHRNLNQQAASCSSKAATVKQIEISNNLIKVLVLGDSQVGKSAAIVRFLTKRFIETYEAKTEDLIYGKQIEATAYDEDANNSTQPTSDTKNTNAKSILINIELVEQTSVINLQVNDGVKACANLDIAQPAAGNVQSSLKSRVAADQQHDNEARARRKLNAKLEWADAFAVLYSIDNAATFEAATDYVRLIDKVIEKFPNQANNSHAEERPLSSTSSSSSSSSSSSFSSLPPLPKQMKSLKSSNENCSSRVLRKKPILLLGNKSDMDNSLCLRRQVTTSEARMFAVRHQAMFAEVSVAQSYKKVQDSFVALIEQTQSYYQIKRRLASDASLLSSMPNIMLNVEAESNVSVDQWQDSLRKFSGTTKSCAQNATLPTAVRATIVRTTTEPATASFVTSAKAQLSVSNPVQVVRSKSPLRVLPLPKNSSTSSFASVATIISTANSGQFPPHQTLSNTRTQSPRPTRYESLKTSFRQASLAIVSTKAIAKNIMTATKNHAAAASLPEIKTECQQQAQICKPEPTSAASPGSGPRRSVDELSTTSSSNSSSISPSMWFKNHIRIKRGNNSNNLTPTSKQNSNTQTITSALSENLKRNESLNSLGHASAMPEQRQAHSDENSGKRSILKYRARRKTVGFNSEVEELIVSPLEDIIQVDTPTKTRNSNRKQSLACLSSKLSNSKQNVEVDVEHSKKPQKCDSKGICVGSESDSSRCSSVRSSATLSLSSETFHSSSVFMQLQNDDGYSSNERPCQQQQRCDN